MLFVAHFSYFGELDESEADELDLPRDTHGRFTAVAEASSEDEALDKFHELIVARFESGEDNFQNVRDVYLDICIAANDVPEAGFISRLSMGVGEPPAELTIPLPGEEDEGLAAFSVQLSDEDDEEPDEDQEETLPFVSFGEEE